MNTQSNDLRYTATKTVGNEVITVKIRLNDECKNGHQDFSVTGEIYAAGKPRTDINMISCGCIHEDIAAAFPEFIPFIRLHLSDYNGVPMYAVANGFYHLQNGFDKCKPDNINFPGEFCEYYRITPDQYEVLKTAKNKTQYGIYITTLGILGQWKNEAATAIIELEKLTGLTFVNDSKRSQFDAPTIEEMETEAQRQKEGYYTPEAEAARHEAMKQSILDELQAELNKEIEKHTIEFEAKKEVFIKGGKKALDNCIYYSHTKEVAFNWRNYDNLPTDFINELIGKLSLPEGVTAKISKG